MKKRVTAAVLSILLCVLWLFPVGAVGAADLTVTDIWWTGNDGQVAPNTELTFSITVKNAGTAASQPFAVELAFGTETIFRVEHTAVLAAGRTVTLKAGPWRAAAGDRMISARADADGVIDELSEKNNTKQRNLRVASNRLSPAHNADAVAEAGMFDLTFNDDFNDLSGIDTAATGREGYKWYVKRRWSQSDLTTNDYSAKDGILTLISHDNPYTIGASTVDCETHAGYTFNKGYLEARLRMPIVTSSVNEKAKTAIWSVPLENWGEGLSHGRYVEVDWYEYFGNNKYGMTLHDMEGSGDNQNWYSSSEGMKAGLGDTKWHVLGWLWEEDSIRMYLDGVEVVRQTWGKDAFPIPANKVQKGEIQFDGVFDVTDAQNMMLFIAGRVDMPLELDYVRIWQKGGQAPVKPTVTTAVTTTKAAPVNTKTTATVTTTATQATTVPTAAERVTTVATTAATVATTTKATSPTTVTATTMVQEGNTEPATFPWAALLPVAAAVIIAAVLVVWQLQKRVKR